MPKLLLINPGHLGAPNWGWRSFPSHLHHMWSALSDAGNVDVVDYSLLIGSPGPENISTYLEAVREDLSRREFDAAGISCWSSLNVTASRAVAEIIRSMDPKIHVFTGGYHPTARPQDFPENLFDVLVRGCGIESLERFLQHGEIPPERIVLNEKVQITKPKWEGFPYGVTNGAVGIYLSRGCPYHCAFCMENVMGRRWLALDPVEAAEAVVETVRVTGTKFLQIYDPLFGLNPKWRSAFLDSLIQRKKWFDRDTFIWAQIRSGAMTADDVKKMSQFRFQLAIGLESASGTILDIMNKTQRPVNYLEQFAQFSAYLDKKKVHHQAFLIFNHPGETPLTLLETRAWILDLLGRKRKSYLTVQGQPYVYFPGSLLDEKMDDLKQNHGTKILHPMWWLEEDDHHAKASAVIPSNTIESAGQLHRWKDIMDEINRRNLAVASKANRPDVESFRKQLVVLGK